MPDHLRALARNIELEGGRRITATGQYLGQPLEQAGKPIDLVFRAEDCIIAPADS